MRDWVLVLYSIWSSKNSVDFFFIQDLVRNLQWHSVVFSTVVWKSIWKLWYRGLHFISLWGNINKITVFINCYLTTLNINLISYKFKCRNWCFLKKYFGIIFKALCPSVTVFFKTSWNSTLTYSEKFYGSFIHWLSPFKHSSDTDSAETSENIDLQW